jgi:hypothetical protein
VLHCANFALPPGRGDFGSVAVDMMDRPGVFLAVLEYANELASTALYANPIPAAFTEAEFGTSQLQRAVAGQGGTQHFVHSGGRAFCVYAVLGSYALRAALVPELNRVISTLVIDPA